MNLFEAPFLPAVEIAWRLSRRAWGHGYATEAATAALDFAFDRLGLEEVVSFTATVNTRSSAVMERLGMIHDSAGDFDHPVLPPGHRLRRHVLYRLSAGRRRDRRTTSAGPGRFRVRRPASGRRVSPCRCPCSPRPAARSAEEGGG
ncbi:GNAT family N-acetyltransferase [Nonomuraea wenchangensis]